MIEFLWDAVKAVALISFVMWFAGQVGKQIARDIIKEKKGKWDD